MRRLAVVVAIVAAALGLGIVTWYWSKGSVHVASTPELAATIVEQPNILLITIDTLRADHLSAYGYTRRTTPNLDQLAAAGVLFRQAIAQYSQTNPSHATMMTGTYPATHGLRLHGVDKLDGTLPTLAEVLVNAGYSTAGIYSWPTLGGQSSGLDRGFQSYQEVVVPASERDQQVPEVGLHSQFDGRANVTSNAAIEWMRRAGPKPFFLWVHYLDPHFPYEPPQPYDQAFGDPCPACPDGSSHTILAIASGQPPDAVGTQHLRDLYDGEIAFTDHEIGRLLEALRELGQDDRTLVVVTSDHGESFGDNGLWSHPWILYDSVVRVPLIVKFPPALPAGTVVQQVARHIDLMPTILELAGVAEVPKTEGTSLVPIIQGREPRADRNTVVETLDFAKMAIVRGRWKLILDTATESSVLYDREKDPTESTDVSQDYPDLVSDLAQTLKAWMTDHGVAQR